MKKLIATSIVLAAALTGAAGAAPLRIATTDLPPLAVEQSREHPGALVEVVHELLRRAEMKGKVDFVPWKRALFMAGHFPQTAVFPLTRSPERERDFQWLVHLYHERFVFVTDTARSGAPDPAQLKGRRIAILRGSAQVKGLCEMGYARLVETASVAEGLRFVHNGMADAVFGDEDITTGVMRRVFPGVEFSFSAPLRTTTTWLGGSADIPAADAARLQQAMRTMLEDGTYARIMRKYDLATTP